MSSRSATTRRVTAESTISGQAVVINSSTGSLIVTGTSVAANTIFNVGIVTAGQTSSQSTVQSSSGASISSIQYLYANNAVSPATAVNTAGGPILINGSSFAANSNVYVNGTLVSSTFIDTTRIQANVPSGSSGTAQLTVFTPSGLGVLSSIKYSGIPSWTTTTVSLQNNIAANVTLVATSDSALTFTLQNGSSLPTGMSLSSNGIISGTPTGYISDTLVSAVIVATDQENQATQQTISFTVFGIDAQFKYTTLLLNGESTSTANNNSTFLDSSTNNYTITSSGAPGQGTFTPFSPTGWCAYFNGSSDYIVLPASSNYIIPPSNDYTIEFWMFANTGRAGTTALFSNYATSGGLLLELNTNGTFNFYYATNTANFTTTGSITEGKWNHIALVRSGGSNITVYINGVSAGTQTYVSTVGKSGSAFYLGVQGPYGISEYFSGYISNFRIVNGTAVYTSAFTPPTTPLTAITNTALLTLQSNGFIDNSTNAASLTINGTPYLRAFSPFAPGVAYSPTTHGGSIYFSGTDDLLQTPSITVGTNAFCFDCWLYPTTAQGSTAGIFVGATTGSFQVAYYGSTGIGLATKAVAWLLTETTALPTLNQWNHLAVVRSGTGTNQTSIFLNGVRLANGTVAADFAASVYQLSTTYAAGSLFQGYISGARLIVGSTPYDPTLSTLTIPTAPPTAITNTSLLLSGTNGAIIDQHCSNDLIPSATSPTTNTSIYKYGTKSMYFTGGNYLVVKNSTSNLSFAGDFTIEFWLYQVTSIGSTSEFMGTISNYVGAASGWCVDEYSHGLRFSYTGASGSFDWYPNLTITMNTWVHIAIVRSGSTITGYLNGTAGSSTQTSSALITSTHDLWIGQGYNSSSGACTFYMDDFRITNGFARYTGNFTPPTTALIAQ